MCALNILDGIRVVEICQGVAGPYSAKLLAHLGADVIKVEPPLVGDSARQVGPFVRDEPDQEGSIIFFYVNAGKRGVTLDVRHPTGSRILKKLIGEADLFIEDHSPRVAQELGLGFESLRQVNPRLVMLSITPFGQTGPYRDYRAYPLNTFHAGGEGRLSPAGLMDPDRTPLKHGLYAGEYEAATIGLVPTLAAVLYAQLTGLGQHVDISKQDALLSLNYCEFQRFINGGEVPRRETRGTKVGGPQPCKDGYIEICMQTQVQWQGFVKLIGNPPWAEEDWCKDFSTRNQNADKINPRITSWFSEHTREEIIARAQEYGCTIGAYKNVAEVVASDQMKAREFFVAVEHPKAGKVLCPSVPYRFAGMPNAVLPAPTLGQHNEDVFGSMLGFTLDELACLREQKII